MDGSWFTPLPRPPTAPAAHTVQLAGLFVALAYNTFFSVPSPTGCTWLPWRSLPSSQLPLLFVGRCFVHFPLQCHLLLLLLSTLKQPILPSLPELPSTSKVELSQLRGRRNKKCRWRGWQGAPTHSMAFNQRFEGNFHQISLAVISAVNSTGHYKGNHCGPILHFKYC